MTTQPMANEISGNTGKLWGDVSRRGAEALRTGHDDPTKEHLNFGAKRVNDLPE